MKTRLALLAFLPPLLGTLAVLVAHWLDLPPTVIASLAGVWAVSVAGHHVENIARERRKVHAVAVPITARWDRLAPLSADKAVAAGKSFMEEVPAHKAKQKGKHE